MIKRHLTNETKFNRFKSEEIYRPSMIKLNIEQQTDEVRDIENFVRELDPIAVVELQSQQVRRLIYFAKKGIKAYKDYRVRANPTLATEITLTDTDD